MKRSRVIIENRTTLNDCDAIEYALTVMRKGRISGTEKKKQYCYASLFANDIIVYADLNKASDRLVVTSKDIEKGNEN